MPVICTSDVGAGMKICRICFEPDFKICGSERCTSAADSHELNKRIVLAVYLNAAEKHAFDKAGVSHALNAPDVILNSVDVNKSQTIAGAVLL